MGGPAPPYLRLSMEDRLNLAPAPISIPSELTREAWLELLVAALRPLIEPFERPFRPVAVSVGWPSSGGLSKKARKVGQCWVPTTTDATANIYISPLLSDPVQVAAVLLHELIHSILPQEVDHKGDFKTIHRAVGFVEKATGSTPGEELGVKLSTLLASLPPMPHYEVQLVEREKAPHVNRQLKLTCPLHPSYIVRASRKIIGTAPPLCGQCAAAVTPVITPMQEPPSLEIGIAQAPKVDSTTGEHTPTNA